MREERRPHLPLRRHLRFLSIAMGGATLAAGFVIVACGVDRAGTAAEVAADGTADTTTADTTIAAVDAPSARDASDAADAFDPCGDASPCILGLSADHTHTCATLRGEKPRCWGANEMGQLGSGVVDGGGEDLRPANSPRAVAVPGPMRTVQVGGFVNANHPFSCAVAPSGAVLCWGADDFGQRGRGDAGADAAPASVPAPAALSASTDVRTSGSHACALRGDGATLCWGYGEVGQLGHPLPSGARFDSLPRPVVLRAPAKRIALGDFHSCVMFADETVDCFGLNNVGQLGRMDALGASTATPGAVSGLFDAKVVAGGYAHTCALVGTGSVSCWGWDPFGQLGRGSPTGQSPTPATVALPASLRARDVCAGYGHTCAVLTDGRVMCWGQNDRGQLGIATTTAGSAVPVAVDGVTGATAVTCGGRHTCALLGNRAALCWGSNDKGQLGRGEPPDDQPHAAAAVAF